MPAGHLAVIDMQRVFADPDGPWATPGFAAIVPTVAALVEAFEPAVTRTRFVAPAEPVGAWVDYYEQWPFARQPPSAALWDVVPPLAGFSLDATTFGKWGPQLSARVGAGPLVLAGVSTDCCVLSTALAAADAGVQVLVVADACAGVSPAAHQRALDAMALYEPLIRVVTSSSVT